MNKLILLTGLFLSVFSIAADKESIERGKTIYNTMCFACHGKHLEGGSGFNLKDAEWVHGGSPEQIFKTIKNGFPDKGMVAFGSIYKDDQIKDVVNFILSKQEGLRDLSYKEFHGLTVATKMNDIKWNEMRADKVGKMKVPYIDFNIPEVDAFGMVFKGNLIIPKSGKYTLDAKLRQGSHFEILINDKPLKFKISKRLVKFEIQLKQGIHSFESRLVKNDKYAHIPMTLSMGDIKIPLTMTSFREQRDTQYIVHVKEPFVMRKKVKGLPIRTIVVAYPEKVNYAFNPLNGAINGLWFGDFMDIAPNINGRGKEHSLPLAEYVFNGDSGIDLLINGKAAKVDYKKYSTYKDITFTYTANGKNVTIASTVQGSALILTYKTAITEPISLSIPEGAKLTSKDGTIKDGTLHIKPSKNKHFTLMLKK